MKYIKKYISILSIILLMTVQNAPVVSAEDVATSSSPEPQVQTSPETQQSATTPTDTSNTGPRTGEGYDANKQERTGPDWSGNDTDTDANDPENAARKYRAEQARIEAEKAAAPQQNVSPTNTSSPASPTNSAPTGSGASQSGQNGDANIKTGDGANTAVLQNSANNNLSTQPSAAIGTSAPGASVVNSGNGTSSNNNGSATINNANLTDQNNSATINNNLNQLTITGGNATSDNTGGDSSIRTGDANVTGTVITTVNTNAAGVMVSEFNVNDDQRGDLVLDFAANCIVGCGISSANVANLGNGSNSTNSSALDTNTTNSTFQNNDAAIGNDLILSADSGRNEASRNTDGDSNITTGDANVSANVLTMANNNIAGNVIYGVVNVFGDLIGDIIFTEDQLNNCCGGNTTVQNSGNGSGSTNSSDATITKSDTNFQNNDATIANHLVFDANTGDNVTSRNTDGDSTVSTGDTTVDANILNIANSNIVGGNMWLLIVNEAGKWVGKIMGAPEGQHFAGAEGSEFAVDENGYITAAINAGNGSGSDNNASVTQSTANTTTQDNTANIGNNLSLSANTGSNTANDNTGGQSKISTGDANIVANLVNFVNNNISGDGKLFVTVVNVFGSWMGDFIAPGQKKEEKSTQSTQATNSSMNTENGRGGSNTTAESTSKSNSSTDTNKTSKNSAANDDYSTTSYAKTENSEAYINGGSVLASNNTPATNVKGASTLVKDAYADQAINGVNNKFTINLAWGLLILPVGILVVAFKKYLYRKLVPTA